LVSCEHPAKEIAMTEDCRTDAKERLQACGISICYGGRSFPEGAMNGKGHLTIQTSGYGEVDLAKGLPLLHDLEETFELEFLGDVADDDLRHLVGLRNILSLKASHGPVSDAGLQYLAGLTSLRVLEFWGLPVTTAGVKHLAGLTNLCELQLSGSQVDDEGLAALTGLTELTVLKLNGCPVTDRGLESLSRLTRLRTLDLGGTRIQGPGLMHLERLGDLEDLTLDRLSISDRDVSVLSRLSKLRSLSLYATQVGDGGAPWLAGLPHLGWLTLSETRVGDDAVRQLRSCEELINVRLDKTKVSGAGLTSLPKNLHVLSLTEVDLQETDIAGLEHLQDLSTLVIDARAASDAVVGRLRRMHLVRRPAYDESVAAFCQLPACPLCREVIEDGSPVFVMRPFYIAEYWQYAKVPIHWDCFARWEKRPDFARRYFEANVGGAENNQFWGVAHRDELSFVSVNPSQYVQEVQVMLAETGSDFRVKLADWQDWLEGEWFEACRHEVEREALGRMIPLFREKFSTAEAAVKAAGFSPDERPAEPEGLSPIMYEFACDDLARRAAEKGLACPGCGEFSNDYEYRKVEIVDPDGPRSVLVCKNCEEEFGPDDF